MKFYLGLISLLAVVNAFYMPPTHHMVPLGFIKLHPPSNLTVGYIGTYNIYIYWYKPENYQLHIPVYMNITHTKVTASKGNKLQDLATTDSADPNKKNVSLSNNGSQDKKRIWPNMTYHVVTKKPEASSTPKGETTVTPIIDWKGHELVPFHKAHLKEYIVTWVENGTDKIKTVVLKKNETDYHILNLKAGTNYKINVTASYMIGTDMLSEELSVTTLEHINKPVSNDDCYCDHFGTKKGGRSCYKIKGVSGSLVVPQCDCEEGHTGLFCQRCNTTYFRTAKQQPCYPCPCNKIVSSGECAFEEDTLTCLQCKPGYGGKHCERCHQGYWRYSSKEPCKACNCRGRSNICDQNTGHCIGCRGNTTGYSCERCADGFIGNPLKNQSCVHKDNIKVTSAHTGGIVAGMCIGLLILVAGVVGFILYKRWKKYPNRKKFWTVELQDDHEKVNFSALPEDEIQARRMDYDFYQDQGGSRGRDGTQKYSHLQEV